MPGNSVNSENSVNENVGFHLRLVAQWRSEEGQLPPGTAGRGAPKSCQRIKKIYVRRNFLNSERIK